MSEAKSTVDVSALLKRFPGLNRLRLHRAPRRIPVIRQLAVTDCAAAALATVLQYFGKSVRLDELRNALGTGRNGASAASILRVGRSYGLRARGVRLDIEDLRHLPSGSILYWEFRHFVVFEKLNRSSVNVVDPSFGRRSIPLAQFRQAFTGIALVMEPGESFQPEAPRSKRMAGLLRQILERKDLLIRIVSTSILTQFLSAILPLFTGILIDRVVPHRDYSLLLALTAGFCIFQAFNTLASYVRAHLLIHLRTQMEVRFTLRFVDHLIDLPYAFFQQHTSGEPVSIAECKFAADSRGRDYDAVT